MREVQLRTHRRAIQVRILLEEQTALQSGVDRVYARRLACHLLVGGGVALLSTTNALRKLVASLEGDEKTGAQIILKAVEEPIRQIAKNAGVDGSVIVEKITASKKANFGFDALKNRYTDMVESGIIDPTKVSRSTLQNAASVAATLLTTESVVTDIPAPEPAAPAAGGGMGGMY